MNQSPDPQARPEIPPIGEDDHKPEEYHETVHDSLGQHKAGVNVAVAE